jgi:predicted kinase
VGDGERVVEVAVQEHDPSHAHRREAPAEVLDQRAERRQAQVHDAPEPDVRIGQRVGHRRSHDGADLLGHAR